MTTITMKNAQALYNKNIAELDNNTKTWTKEDIESLKKDRLTNDNLYFLAEDYNSLIIVIKYLTK